MKLIKYKLKDIAYIEISGVDKKTKENETPIKLCNFVNVYHNWAITKDNYSDFMAATANDKEIACCKIKKGQVAITKDSETRDDIGIPTYIADNFDDVLLGYHCALFTPDTKVIDGKYLNAFLNSTFAKKYFEFNASGSGQRYTLSNSVIDEIPVYLPDLPTQKLIGNLFSEIDKKIALNNKTNSELENMAKTVYDYWFTQFDFPDANGTPYKSSGGKMEYNQVLKREIPAGWEVGKLGDYLDKFGDGIHGTPEYDENGDYYFINGNNLGKKLISFNSETLKVNANEYQKIKRPINENTIFLSINGTLGNISFYNGEKIAIGKSACFLNLKNEKLMTFVYQIISSENFQKYMYKVAGGSTIKNFAPKQAADFDIPIPPTAILEKFDKISHSCLEKQIKKEKENEELTNLRDYLLPLLMNGQIEVK